MSHDLLAGRYRLESVLGPGGVATVWRGMDTRLVVELVEGTSLTALLMAGPLDPAPTVGIAVQVCDTLDAAHTAGVVHRDIKPGNILIDGKGTVKVCDFGIARLVGAAQPTLTGADTAIGTGQYMAPEQVAGTPVDARTDLYALGCVLCGSAMLIVDDGRAET